MCVTTILEEIMDFATYSYTASWALKRRGVLVSLLVVQNRMSLLLKIKSKKSRVQKIFLFSFF